MPYSPSTVLRTFDAMPQEGNISLFFQPTFSSKKADADADADVSKEPPDKQAMGSATISARKAGHNTIMAGKFSATWSEKQNRWNVYHGGTHVTSAVKEQKARAILSQLCDGTRKSQRASASASATLGTRFSGNATCAAPSPQQPSAHSVNPWGCKGKPDKVSATQVLSSPKKRARAARTAVSAIDHSSSYEEVISLHVLRVLPL